MLFILLCSTFTKLPFKILLNFHDEIIFFFLIFWCVWFLQQSKMMMKLRRSFLVEFLIGYAETINLYEPCFLDHSLSFLFQYSQASVPLIHLKRDIMEPTRELRMSIKNFSSFLFCFCGFWLMISFK